MLILLKKSPCLDFLVWTLLLHSSLLPTLIAGGFIDDNRHPIEDLTQKDVNTTVEMALRFLEGMHMKEHNIQTSNFERGSANRGFYISYIPDEDAIDRGRAGWTATRSAQMMLIRHCSGLYDETKQKYCEKKSAKYNFSDTKIGEKCKQIRKDCTIEEFNSPYRSITGFCNHHKGNQGESYTAYSRIISPVYSNNIEGIRRAANKQILTNARQISAAITKFTEINHDSQTMAVLQWAQFIEQDLSRVAISPMYNFDTVLSCCASDGLNLAPRHRHQFCLPITIADDSYYHRTYKHCMNYVRSLAAMRPDCSFGPNEQMNQATHYLDASQIYGSSYKRHNKLRDFSSGNYKMSTINNKDYLPLSSKPTEDCLYSSNKDICFMSGDPRVNFEPQVTVMHTLWAREHNRIVQQLTQLNNSQWNKNDLFEEARRIVIAEIQHITYNEWAKEVLDKKSISEISNYNTYDEKVDPSVSNSVGATVFRAFKSMYPDHTKLYNETRKETGTMKLKDHYFKPAILGTAGVFDKIVRGMTTQASGKIDRHFSEDLINNLYFSDDFGYDVLALDIQRGRDHGLPPYNNYRKYVGLRQASSIKDFEDVIAQPDIEVLTQIYSNPNDVDLIIGGILEKTKPGSLFGPTFSWLLTNQLIRTRVGDRYFYTNPLQPKPFTPRQLEEIQKVTFARILCDNSDGLRRVQPNVFEIISKVNPLVTCDSNEIPGMDLSVWLDNKEKYYMSFY